MCIRDRYQRRVHGNLQIKNFQIQFLKMFNKAIALFAILALIHCQDKIKLDFFVESLCPDCMDFMENSFIKAYKVKDIEQIVEWNFQPYGNAHQKKEGNKWTFTCQHGEKECYGNLMETCAIASFSKIISSDFIICLEKEVKEPQYFKDFDKAAAACESILKIDLTSVKECMKSDKGNELEHQVADKTDALQPPHNYVPWITVNGNHYVDDENKIIENMLGYVCSAYKGPIIIDACKTSTI
eukprot:TRINITY_DN111_c0_g1_i1.p1 TRINITY_DN111_c0_g1~~TRINITY_DN111_c0_g1_i1.p1  ORF type:complete len:241 (+),score=97.34 TRINITY_DN111_c0_g1_i1:3-725(+)